MITIMTTLDTSSNEHPTGRASIRRFKPTYRVRFVKNKSVDVVEASNYWSSSEYNATNCWNQNFNNGNVNNNNRYNSNYVRALAALGDEWKMSWYQAYLDCIRHKLGSHDCCTFRMLRLDEVWQLMVDVHDLQYKPGISKTFCVSHPKVREIFAADFRDRIVHHWIYNELNPIIENLFETQCNISYNCRKGYGTLRCINAVVDDIHTVQHSSIEPDEKGPWILKIDIRSFFMSIDRRLLWQRVKSLITEHYNGKWKKELLHVVHATLAHSPQQHCVRCGDLSLWNVLPSHKSLFNAPPLVGTPIGNLPSQQFDNFFMLIFDIWLVSRLTEVGGMAKRFVDDIEGIVPRKEDAKRIVKDARAFLERELHLTLHPDKVYLQPVRHGVQFIGTVIKGKRRYTSNRTVDSFCKAVRRLDRTCAYIVSPKCKAPLAKRLFHLRKAVDSVNAYIGLMSHHDSYAIRSRHLFACQHLAPLCHIEGHSLLIRINKKVLTARTVYRLLQLSRRGY